MSSIVEICNIGLQALGVPRIASLTDTTSKAAREMNVAYEPTRQATLRMHPWAFAVARVQLAADSTGPAFDFTYYYTLPSDCLRILPPNDVDTDWRVEGRKIATNWSAPLDLRYIQDVTDPNTMDPLFREALGLRLALRTCKALTQSNTLKADIEQDLKDIMVQAKATNAIEKVSDDFPEDNWITCRA